MLTLVSKKVRVFKSTNMAETIRRGRVASISASYCVGPSSVLTRRPDIATQTFRVFFSVP